MIAMKTLNKKGLLAELGILPKAAIMFVVAAIVIGLGAGVMAGIRTTQAINSSGYNTSGLGLDSVNTLATNMPTMATVVAAALIISIVSALLVFGNKSE